MYPEVDFLYLNEQEMIKAGVKNMPKCIDTMEDVLKCLTKGDFVMGGENHNSHGCMVYMIWNISTGETRIKIFELCGVLFAGLVVYSIIWVCGVMKASPFQPVPVEVINDASVKFNELVKKENEEKALAGAEGEVN